MKEKLIKSYHWHELHSAEFASMSVSDGRISVHQDNRAGQAANNDDDDDYDCCPPSSTAHIKLTRDELYTLADKIKAYADAMADWEEK